MKKIILLFFVVFNALNAFCQVSWGFNLDNSMVLSGESASCESPSTANNCFARSENILKAETSGSFEFQYNFVRPSSHQNDLFVGITTTSIDPSMIAVTNTWLGIESYFRIVQSRIVNVKSEDVLFPEQIDHFAGNYYKMVIDRENQNQVVISTFWKPTVDATWIPIVSFNNDGLYEKDLQLFVGSKYAGPVISNLKISFSNAALLADGSSAWLTETANEANSYTNGKVAIGYDQNLSGGSHSLYVAEGGTRATRVKVDESSGAWPDYVFEDSYNLTSLAEVDEFIRANKHLPNVPSEAEVKEDGINVEGMVRVLLEKIEELTLYTIEQQKEIERLKLERGTE